MKITMGGLTWTVVGLLVTIFYYLYRMHGMIIDRLSDPAVIIASTEGLNVSSVAYEQFEKTIRYRDGNTSTNSFIRVTGNINNTTPYDILMMSANIYLDGGMNPSDIFNVSIKINLPIGGEMTFAEELQLNNDKKVNNLRMMPYSISIPAYSAKQSQSIDRR